jgi:teichuronic acid biosynthesis glycosyltransferase TuaC
MIKVLVACSSNNTVKSFKMSHPFVYEQMNELEKLGVTFEIFLVKEKGVLGYLKSLKRLNKIIKEGAYDLIHAHYGYMGLLSVLQFRLPVVINFIGCDINVFSNRVLSWVAMLRSEKNIFVSNQLRKKSFFSIRSEVIPYGVDFNMMYPVDRKFARRELNIDPSKHICLFGSVPSRFEKNFELARKAVSLCHNVDLICLTGKDTKEKVNLLINASNLVLLTSLREGSPQIIKEAMACNVPIVSTDVGDVKQVIGDTKGCYIAESTPNEIAKYILKAQSLDSRTNGRFNLNNLDTKSIALKIYNIYTQIIN